MKCQRLPRLKCFRVFNSVFAFSFSSLLRVISCDGANWDDDAEYIIATS